MSNDNMEQIAEQISDLMKQGYEVCTVADLAGVLAGLPPMMPVFIDADGTSMYMNHAQVHDGGKSPPFLRLLSSENPKRHEYDLNETYEERLAKQRQKAMQMAHNTQQASKMPPMVD